MENDRSLKVDVAVNGYRDEDGKYNILSYDVDTPKEQGSKEDTLTSEKIIEVKDIEDVLKGDMPDETLIKTPKGITLTAGQIREETRNFKYTESPLASDVKSKRVEAIEFLTKKDKKKYDFKAMLRDCLKGVDDEVKNNIIRSIYKIKVLNKSFKHLNINSKRIALNNYFSDRLIFHTAKTGEATIDLLSMLKNDNNILDYLVLLKKFLIICVNRKIALY